MGHLEAITVIGGGISPVNTRMRLGLGPKEVAEIKQVLFATRTVVDAVEYHHALSSDAEEGSDLETGEAQAARNILAMMTWRLDVVTSGVREFQYIIIPFPGNGFEVAGDVTYMLGGSGGNIAGTCSVWFTRRKEKPGEREQLIMSRR